MKALIEGGTKHFYEFGPFRLDPTKRLLLRDGMPQPLTPKALDILLVLVRHGDQVVGKDELMRAVWPDTAVEENNLTRNISALRKALGEGPQDHNYVVTVPGRGYSFVAGVRDSADEPAELLMAKYTRTHVVVEEEDVEETGERDSETRTIAKALPHKQDLFISASPLSRVSASSFKLIVLISMVLLAVAIAYFLIWGRPRRAEPTRLGVPSVAVLPFHMISSESGNEYLGVGMADALITRLGNVRAVVVRPTSAVRRYVDPDQDPVVIGQKLKVEYVLQGSIQRSEDRIRVSVQLVNVQDGAPLWAENFDERFTGVFAVQDSISLQVARALKPELTGEERRVLAKRYTENTEAYQEYLRGRYLGSKRTIEDLKRSIGHFEQAMTLDPNFALAFAGLADSYSLLAVYDALPPSEVTPKAKATAMKALEMDDTLAEAHTSLGFILSRLDWNWSGAEKEFKRAIELNPNYATAHHWYSTHLMFMKRFDEARVVLNQAEELDPLSLSINAAKGALFYRARQYDHAIAHYQKVMKLHSDYASGGMRIHLGQAYEQKGMYDEAIAEFVKARELSGDGPDALASLGHAYAVSGQREQALKVIYRLKELSTSKYVPSYFVAIVYSGLGERDQALEWLEKAYEERSSWLGEIQVDPRLDGLRSDPRFEDIARRVGLESRNRGSNGSGD